MISGVRWLVSIGLGLPTALILLGNWLSLIGTLRTRKPTSLVFPFVCGPTCAVACLVCPVARVRALAWCPLVLDVSLLAVGVAVLTGLVSRRREGPPSDGGADA